MQTHVLKLSKMENDTDCKLVKRKMYASLKHRARNRTLINPIGVAQTVGASFPSALVKLGYLMFIWTIKMFRHLDIHIFSLNHRIAD